MQWTTMRSAGLAAGLALGLAGCSFFESADTNLSARLSGAQEVPPVQTRGNGTATMTLNKATKTLTYSVSYAGLSGPATAAHFHGPAPTGTNAGVAVPITVGANPMTGTAQLTDAQMADLLADRWYINIHTDANKGGEIRGQVVPGN
jgi:hypothetical protein